MIRVTKIFYRDLCISKSFKNFAREEILKYLKTKIILKIIIELLILITINKIKKVIQRAILEKSLENNDIFLKYYKILTSYLKKKNKEKRDYSLIIKRLISLYNYI